MKGYAFILNGKVVINPKKEPTKNNSKYWRWHWWYYFAFNKAMYNADIKEWESNCIEAENVWFVGA